MTSMPLAEVAAARTVRRNRPVIVDSMVVISDVIHSLRRPRFTSLTLLSVAGAVELYAGDHVFEEVEKHLPRLAERGGLDVEGALEHWRVEYAPTINFVKLPPTTDPRVAAVAAIDPDDAPTAQLAILLAPCHVLSRDRSLTRTGFSDPDWLPVVQAHGHVVAVEWTAWFSARVAETTGRLLVSFAKWIRGQPAPVALGTLLVAALALGAASDDSEDAGEKRDTRKRDETIDAAAAAVAKREESQALLAVTEVRVDRVTLEQQIARALIGHSDGLTTGRLLAAVNAAPELRGEIEAVLREHPAFVRRSRRWRLGRPRGDIAAAMKPQLGPPLS